MIRKLTPRSSLDNLKREAKRWLKALHEKDTAARVRLENVVSDAPRNVTLRDVQHALALEYGYDGWASFKTAVRANTAANAINAIGADDGGNAAASVTALLHAASTGDAERVAELLDAEPDIVSARGFLERSYRSGTTGLRTALHFAVGGSHQAVVALLLERGADPNARDEGDNAMPLHFAAEQGNLGLIRLLIEHGADPIGTDDGHGLEVIGWATCFGAGRRDIVDYLLAHGAKHNIFSAVATGSVDVLRAIGRADRATIDARMDRANQYRRPLHLSIVKKQSSALDALLELGADAEVEDAAGLTPLDQAALAGEREMANRLLAHGARLRLPAAVVLDRDIERLLRDNPAALEPGERWGTLIVRAAERSTGRVIETLLRNGASANVEDGTDTAIDGAKGYTPLHAAAFHGNHDAAKVLLAHGASVTARDDQYFGTPAGWANYAKHPEMRDLILAGPIDMFDALGFDLVSRFREIFDRDAGTLNRPMRDLLPATPQPGEWTKPWWTPLLLAVTEGKIDAVRELLALGARTDVADPDGRDLITIAESLGHFDIARLIRENSYENNASMPAVETGESMSRAALVARFLTNAAPDHHIRGGHSHIVAINTAEQLLAAHPDIARENIFTAVVCGDLAYVNELLAADASLARDKGGPKGSAGAQGAQFVVDAHTGVHPKWELLIYLCFTRLNHTASNDNAVAIARALLDHGADPNAYFMAGDSRYSPLTGVIGEGEEARLPHPRRDELARLLLERGANPYDIQVFYNINFDGHLLWFLEMAYEESLKRGRGADWADPNWPMFDMGGYGSGARFTLSIAIRKNDLALAAWALSHGASANAPPPRDPRFPKSSLYDEAIARGALEIADMLVRHGATPTSAPLDHAHAFIAACLRHDRPAAQRLALDHPNVLQSALTLHHAAAFDDVDASTIALDLGVSPEVANATAGNQRALHVCAAKDAPRVAQLLIDRGASVDAREQNYSATPLGFAIYGQRKRMIDLLTRYSSDIWNIAFVGAVDRVRDVLAARPALARVAYPDEGTTPLMRLPGDEHAALQIAQLLLDHGADPSVKNSEGLTAADLAQQRGMESVAALLRRTTH